MALATGLVCYRVSCDPALRAAVQKRDAMEWLRADFHLTPAQFAEIKRLHDAYAPSCEEHCRLIQEVMRARDALSAARHADPAALAAANARLQELRTLCETALAGHVREVAAIMAPDDGRRYLSLVLPKIANFDHVAAPDLRLNHSS
jgi:hypothetical protein